MAYYVDVYSPETYEAFGKSDRTVSGFRPRQHNAAHRVVKGDALICYMIGLSRWIGVLRVEAGPYSDRRPIFHPSVDPFTLRFKVRAEVWLPLDQTIPIHEIGVWKSLSFTRHLPQSSTAWTGKVRTSLVHLPDADGRFLESLLRKQASAGRSHPVDLARYNKLLAAEVLRR